MRKGSTRKTDFLFKYASVIVTNLLSNYCNISPKLLTTGYVTSDVRRSVLHTLPFSPPPPHNRPAMGAALIREGWGARGHPSPQTQPMMWAQPAASLSRPGSPALFHRASQREARELFTFSSSF